VSVLVLFDIDGTLIRTEGAGVRGMDAALERLHGCRRALDGIPVSGRTDRAILAEIFDRQGIDPSSVDLDELLERYVASLAEELREPRGPRFGVLPGVVEALDALGGDPRFRLGLLTGNIRRGAEVKLAHFGLWERFDFGAFGDDHVDRRDLVPVALDEARAVGFDPAHVVVVGDTPLDVDCAHAHGARAVAVATGEYPYDALVRTGADVAVRTLDELHPWNERLAALCGV
jgi:phosphoglycolate phosphatase